MQCHQQTCSAEASLCYRWPGEELAGICADCSQKAQRVAGAMGFTLDFLPIQVLLTVELDRVARFELASALRDLAEKVENGWSFEDISAAALTNLASFEAKKQA